MYLGRLKDHAERRKRVVQQFFVHLWIQIADEDVGSDVQILLMRRRLVDAYRFAVQLYHVHDFDRIVGIVLAEELDETVALVHLGDTILGHVHIHWRM